MEYREDRKGQRLSILGYGCMRFTKNGSAVDLDKAEQELMYAIRHGVNYLDTAYVYAGNEEAVGTILERNHCRRDIFLATKLPHYLIKSRAGAQKKFEEELRRLRTDYIDFYLMHMLNDVKTWESLVRIGIADWIAEKKVSGEIRSIGFSYHGNSENFRALLDAYDWDFCQIQYNYLDEHSQAGREGLEYAAKKGIPVIIMEPLRGGRLVQHLPQTAKEQIASSLSLIHISAYVSDCLYCHLPEYKARRVVGTVSEGCRDCGSDNSACGDRDGTWRLYDWQFWRRQRQRSTFSSGVSLTDAYRGDRKAGRDGRARRS